MLFQEVGKKYIVRPIDQAFILQVANAKEIYASVLVRSVKKYTVIDQQFINYEKERFIHSIEKCSRAYPDYVLSLQSMYPQFSEKIANHIKESLFQSSKNEHVFDEFIQYMQA